MLADFLIDFEVNYDGGSVTERDRNKSRYRPQSALLGGADAGEGGAGACKMGMPRNRFPLSIA